MIKNGPEMIKKGPEMIKIGPKLKIDINNPLTLFIKTKLLMLSYHII